jgi:formylglycine-generating enzyme
MNLSRVWVSVCVVSGLLAGSTDAVNIVTVPVSNPGNAPDARYGGYGAVSYTYQMGKFDVTAGQYCQFLNAVARTDTYDLYSYYMGDPSGFLGCNIVRSGSPGSYTYSVAPGWANRPVNYVSWGDAARFVNWLANGQPTGPQGLTTTEDGSYYINGAMTWSQLSAVARKANARYVIPTTNEWYKAAYYDPNKSGGPGYWDFPTLSNRRPSNILDPNGRNNANFYDYYGTGNFTYTIGAPYYRTEVGAFASSAGPYGTFDQGGNVFQWTETISNPGERDLRGGAFMGSAANYLIASAAFDTSPTMEDYLYGFRIAEVPEPATLMPLVLGGVAMMRRKR